MTSSPLIVIIGAGAIGRSFLGQLFSRAGWEVVFIDIDIDLIAELNRQRSYTLVIKRDGQNDETHLVEGVRAINANDQAAVSKELSVADLAAVSVGKTALPSIAPLLSRGLIARAARTEAPLDLIIAENDREASDRIISVLKPLLPPRFPLARRLGLVRTSIGKMVPISPAADLAVDRLRLNMEAYNNLIVDRRAFLGPVPEIEGINAVNHITAYEDRKLFIHNLGHAAAAYLGFLYAPNERYLHRVLKLPKVLEGARLAMDRAAVALAAEYPGVFTSFELAEHIDDLLTRFGNAALGDSVYRVGRDLARKLSASDRVLGPIRLCQRWKIAWEPIEAVFRSALVFGAVDEAGRPFPADLAFRSDLNALGLERTLIERLGLNPMDTDDLAIIRRLSEKR